MKNESRHTKISLITGIIFVILFSHLPVVYTLLYHNLTGAPKAEDGLMDLTEVSLARKTVLDGKWEFYWNCLIATDEQHDNNPDFHIKVPDYWTRYKINGKWLPAGGFGSYRLILRGLDYPNPVTVFIPDFGSAYRVFIDGELTAESGTVSKNIDKVFTVTRPHLYPVTLSDNDEHEIVIEVASKRFSGLYKAPVLKDYNLAVKDGINRAGIRFILFGTVLFSFFILVVIYMLSFRKNVNMIWLPLMGILVVLRIMLTNEFYSYWQSKVFFNLSYEDTNKLMFFVSFALKFLLIFLAQEQFGVLFSRKEKCGFLLYYTVIYLIYLVIPNEIYNRYFTVLLPASSFVLEIYSFIKIYL